MRPMYYDFDGKPINAIEWALLFNDAEGRTVGKDRCGPYLISTVWLGLDHGIFADRPILFETMVFSPDESDIECVRYSTWAEAEEGHKRMVERYAVFRTELSAHDGP